jgi:hypothetical protein
VYIGQKAVLAVTGSGGPVGAAAALDASLVEGVVDCEQPAKSSTATAIALIAHCLNALIGIPPLTAVSRVFLEAKGRLRSAAAEYGFGRMIFVRVRKRPGIRHGLTY